MNKTRLEAFSDGVLAIIITIMVLEIKVPHSADWLALKPLLPTFISYLMSFVFVGIYWGNHHHVLHSLKNISSAIIWGNMNLLFWLSLIPFATGWMGENNFAANTIAVYAALLLFCGASFVILQKAIEKHSKDIVGLKSAFLNLAQKGSVSTIGYAVAIPLAYINPLLSGVIIAAISIMWLVPDKRLEKVLTQPEDQ